MYEDECHPDYAIKQRDRYHETERAYHFNKKYRNQVYLQRNVPASPPILKLKAHSDEEVIKKFTRKQKEIMNYPEPIYVHETTSTNSYLSQLCNQQQPDELTSVWTDFQTAGRGQRGNSWESEQGANLLFSFVVFPTFLEVRRQFILSQITALALYEVLSLYTDSITIKWPNDIYWKEKKICGTLIENDLTGIHLSRSISGTGVNLNQQTFVSDAPNPISLFQITGKRYDRKEILDQIMQRIAGYYDLLRQGKSDLIATRYFSALYRREGFYLYKDAAGIFKARIYDIDPIGKLILQDEQGQLREYMFKEVSYVL